MFNLKNLNFKRIMWYSILLICILVPFLVTIYENNMMEHYLLWHHKHCQHCKVANQQKIQNNQNIKPDDKTLKQNQNQTKNDTSVKEINKIEKKIVVFQTLQLSPFKSYFQKVIAEYEKQHPDIKIKWIDVPYSEGEKRTLASVLSNNPPDLVNLTPDFSSVLAKKKALYPIEGKYIKSYNPQIMKSLKLNNKYFALPFYATSAITLYNKEIFEKAKLDEVPKTYDDIFKQAKTVKKKTDKYILMPTLTENDSFVKILAKYDINVFSSCEKINKQNINENKTTIKLYPFNSRKTEKIYSSLKRLYRSNLIPSESINQTHTDALQLYMSEMTMMIVTGANFLNIIKENAPEVYKKTLVSYQITGDNGKYDFSLMNLCIPQKSRYKKEALDFALFLTNKNNQLKFTRNTLVLPVNNQALSIIIKESTLENKSKKINNIDFKAKSISAKQLNNLQDAHTSIYRKSIIERINITTQHILLRNLNINKLIENTQKEIDSICIK